METNSKNSPTSVLEKILDYSAENMNPLRVLYNLEVGCNKKSVIPIL